MSNELNKVLSISMRSIKLRLEILKNAGSQGSDIGGRDVQYELLKLVEGGKVAIKSNDQQGGFAMSSPTVEIDTTNILIYLWWCITGIERRLRQG